MSESFQKPNTFIRYILSLWSFDRLLFEDPFRTPNDRSGCQTQRCGRSCWPGYHYVSWIHCHKHLYAIFILVHIIFLHSDNSCSLIIRLYKMQTLRYGKTSWSYWLSTNYLIHKLLSVDHLCLMISGSPTLKAWRSLGKTATERSTQRESQQIQLHSLNSPLPSQSNLQSEALLLTHAQSRTVCMPAGVIYSSGQSRLSVSTWLICFAYYIRISYISTRIIYIIIWRGNEFQYPYAGTCHKGCSVQSGSMSSVWLS